ncbi:filamentous hemagglutinin N-terminal domain-containing protein [Calothrix sp. PCC 7507]|uniref:two-partner secretion domain-containing protein n=1 Tax=Calothrix sp. PCC 7507 TaxID=99598 RepID=UPI00029F1A98|nr:filamentous hemagglutinin N-terminal domain-containing protein [Calothrix sp. PCC 7507]AFY34501.1 filamentous hemagglutinin family outer membrane protein [Calothrix sp. PCC 7507]
MAKNWLVLVSRVLAIAIAFIYPSTKVCAQNITLDGSLGTRETLTGPNYTIPQSAGQTVGNNLFHSFGKFNLNSNEAAIFQNADNIRNILSRVTSGSQSLIDGLIRTQSGVNLFLINPSGIIFGKNARLDVGGSFVASTANSLKFPDNLEFSATNNLQQPPLLSINVPIGLQYGKQQPGEITLQGQGNSELRVTPGNSLILAGGKINVNQFKLFAPGGKIELAGIAGDGIVDLQVNSNDVDLSLPQKIGQADVTLKNSTLDITADSGRGIKINARNLDLSNSNISSQTQGKGDAGSVLLQTVGSIFLRNSSISSVTYGQGNSGNISLTAKGAIFFDTSSISTSTPSGLGDAGKISLQANGSIAFVGGGIFSDVAYGRGSGGSISLVAGDSILVTQGVTFDSEAISDRSGAGNILFQAGNSVVISDNSRIYSTTGGKGDAGRINLQARSFSLLNGSELVSTTSNEGKGGDIEINTTDAVNISGLYPDGSLLKYSSIRSNAIADATAKKAGDIKITTQTFQLSDAAVLNAGTSSSARGGDITINSRTVEITGGAKLLTSTFGFNGGNAGNITINASEKIAILGSDRNYFPQQQARQSYLYFNDQISPASGLFSNTTPGSNGNGGRISLQTPTLLLANGATVVTSTIGSGKAGDIYLGSPDEPIKQITISGANTGFFANTQASSITLPLKFITVNEIGEAGQLPSTAQKIPTIGTFVEKISGSLDSSNDVDLYQIELEGNQTFSAETFVSNVRDTRLFLFDSNGIGVYANDDTIFSSFDSYQSSLPPKHPLTPKNPGTYYLAITQYPITAVSNGGEVFSFLTPTEISGATGKGGSLPLSGWIGDGFEQDKYTILLRGLTARPQILPGGDGGNITVHAASLIVKDSAQLTTSTSGNGKAGNITINAVDSINLLGSSSGVYANTTPGSSGNGGNIIIDPKNMIIRDGAKIAVDSQGEGIGGNIELAAGILTLNNGTISAETRSSTGGNITLNLQDLLLLRNGSKISTTAGNNQFAGNSGNININSKFIVAVPNENSDISANAFTGTGGKVTINATGIYGITPRSREELVKLLGTNKPQDLDPAKLFTSDITAISQTSPILNGDVILNTPDLDPTRGLTVLPTNLVDVSKQIAQGCTPKGKIASHFTSTGRGGLPLNPDEPLRGRAVMTNWVTLGEGNQQIREITNKSTPETIIEAQSWVINSDGKVELVAYVPGSTFNNSSLLSNLSCNAFPSSQ